MHDGRENDEVTEQLKALGYIDPGAGSSMWQVMLARFFKASARIQSLFRGKGGDEEE